ncbi:MULTISPECIES: hypothetical protein [Nocardia]|uniref:DUF8020 domain-containing protein n=1 Tax=Nocardia vulneris TaxID=1141657 RepID=A0ABR4ZFF1_9NOCA|nr:MULTISPECIES: hypothetical protein [Nocardia]ASF11083.1 hypothetical protein CEQ30_31305 [Nocardia brasiliensis]KIA64045.1 hypothetical protein FG87_15390 [Nocardia vulneris]GAJ83212.1 hypothetical protein NBRGN_062_00490 [Nocardia brasiliensis NBRC 14402]SUB10239.1 Uncharacterised protein [Nocardia brasiliensis]
MNLRRTTAGAALVIGAMTIGLGTAHAEPVAAPADSGINYSVKLVDKTVVASLKGGTFSVTEQDGATAEDPKLSVANVRDGQGNTLVSFPLEVDVDGTLVPVKTEVKKDGTVLEITPQKPEGLVVTGKPVAARPSVAQDIASPIENQRAQNEFASKFGIATAIGGFIGTAIGAVVGFFLGLPIFGVGGLLGIPVGAGIGGILGTIIVGGPALVAAGLELINTIQAPDGTTQWADKPQPVK